MTNTVLQQFTIINDLVATEINISSKLETAGLRKVEDRSLESQITPYNAEFWMHYNGIKQTPLESKVMNDLIQESSLPDQFQKSGSGNSKNKKKK